MADRQTSLFDVLDRIPATDTNVAQAAKKRLSGQNRKILDLLMQGQATGRQIQAIGMKYTSRISDLRKAGCVIDCLERPDGNSLYTLAYVPPGL